MDIYQVRDIAIHNLIENDIVENIDEDLKNDNHNETNTSLFFFDVLQKAQCYLDVGNIEHAKNFLNAIYETHNKKS